MRCDRTNVRPRLQRTGSIALITTADLKTQTRRDLADLARQHEITGWHGMRKDELIDALRKVQRQSNRKASKSAPNGSSKAASARKAAPSSKAASKKASPAAKDLKGKASSPKLNGSTKSRGSSRKAASESKASAVSKPAVRSKSPRAAKSAAKDKPAAASKPTVKSSSLTSRSTKRRKPAARKPAPEPPKKSKLSPASLQKLREKQMMRERLKDLSVHVLVGGKAASGNKAGATQAAPPQPAKDRASVQRAQAALSELWHTAKPVLRLVSITDASANAAEQKVRDIPIHGGVNNWYIDILGEPTRYRVVVGYVVGRESEDQRFYALCRSNIIESPAPNTSDAIDGHWQDIAEDYERVFSLSGGHNEGTAKDLREVFEERLRRPMTTPDGQRMGDAADISLRRQRELPFEVDAELIVYGSTAQGSTVSLGGEPVKLNEDGTFTLRMELPDRRQVLPVVATSRDGMRQRTTIISVERNTKVMEPYQREEGDM